MSWLDCIKRRGHRFSSHTRRRPRCPFALLWIEELEPRVTPTGNIAITNASVVDANDNLLTTINGGEKVYIQADFTTANLPANASYRVGYTVNGLTQDTGYLTWGAGSSGTSSWNAYWGTFLATPGTNQVIVTVDPDHSVAETSYADNTMSFTFNAVTPAAGTFISYTAAQMRNAYGVNSIPNFGSAAPDGSGQTIALINGGNDPTVFADVDGFDQTMSLTTTSTQTIYQQYGAASSFLSVYNQYGVNITANIANSGSNGVPPLPTSSEESWDVEWAHAMAPGAKIDEIEFDDTGNWGANLIASYAVAATLPGVSAVNWSGGLSQWNTESADDTSVFVTPSGHVGVTFICPSNDNGANVYPSYGQGDGYYPSTSPNVVSVGGTTLNLNNGGYGSETGWSYPTPTTTVTPGSASYSQTGAWSSQVGGFSGTYSTATAGSSSTATWTIPITSANTGWGTELSATWNAGPGNASNTTYTVYDGTAATGTLLGTITLNQTQAPVGTADGSAQFQELGVFFPTLSANGTGTLTVVVNAQSANGRVVADAIGAAPAWASTGGPALFESEPAYQTPFQSTGYRTTPDVSFDADFSADGYGGGEITYGGGGTSLGGPCWDGLFAVVNQGRVAEGASTLNSPSNPQQALEALYSLPASDFHDITSGYNGFSAGAGYDEVTGRGTPIANTLIPDLASYGLTPTVTSVSPNSESTAGGTSVTIIGSNLLGATAVKFGTVAATHFTVVSHTQITAVDPAEAAGTVDVTVTTSGGTTATSAADKFAFSGPIPPPPPPKPDNFDKLGAYRPSDGSWSLDSNGGRLFDPATSQVFLHFSPPGVTGVAGDWNGTGRTNIGDFSNGVWHLDLAGTGAPPGANETFQFGQAGDQPVVGDWDGNPSGRDEMGVFRTAPDGITGEFILDIANHKTMDSSNLVFTFGFGTDHIVVGDWNGKGTTEVGVYRDAKKFIPADAGDIVFSINSNGDHATFTNFVFGLITDHVVIGDWTGSGTSKVGVYRDGANGFNAPGVALFSLDSGALMFNAQSQVFLFGLISDQFVSGNWPPPPPLLPAEFAANGQGPGGVPALTDAQLAPVLQQAIMDWQAVGANVASLEAVPVRIGHLDDALVGWTGVDGIVLDADAAGWGWNVDPTNAVFTSASADGLQAQAGSAAAGQMDLLTVVEHELGHELGLSDVDPASHPGDVMAATLPTGVRRMPTPVDILFTTLGINRS